MKVQRLGLTGIRVLTIAIIREWWLTLIAKTFQDLISLASFQMSLSSLLITKYISKVSQTTAATKETINNPSCKGQAIGLIVAETSKLARAAARAVKVDYI